MSLFGHVRDSFPRLSLTLPGRMGTQITVEFIVDTGFDGELSLPSEVIRQLDVEESSARAVVLADRSSRVRPSYEVLIEIEDESRRTEVLE